MCTFDIFRTAQRISNNIALFMPKNTNIDQVRLKDFSSTTTYMYMKKPWEFFLAHLSRRLTGELIG